MSVLLCSRRLLAALATVVVAGLAALAITAFGVADAKTGIKTIGPGPSSNTAGVKCIQRALGISPADGRYGQATYTAVKRFQKARGLRMDGAVGPETGSRLLSRTPVGCAGSIPTLASPSITNTTSTTSTSPSSPARSTSAQSKPLATYGPVTVNCGKVTCSAYLSRSATRYVSDATSNLGSAPGVPSVIEICGKIVEDFVRVPEIAPVVGVSCAAHGLWISKEVADAVNNHPPNGACLKATFPATLLPSGPGPIYWSTNNGEFCKNR